MFVYLLLVWFLHVYSIQSLKLRQMNDKLANIEDRINAESKNRRDDFNTLFNGINSLKEMMQKSAETKMVEQEIEDDNHGRNDITKELEEKIHRLAIGFKEEKMANVRLKKKTNSLFHQIVELKSQTEKNGVVLERLLKGVNMLAKQKNERENCYSLIKGDISEIKTNVQNYTNTLEQTQSQEEQRLLKTFQMYMETIKENIQNLETKKNLCLSKENISTEEIIPLEGGYDSSEEKMNSAEYKICHCSNATFLEQRKLSPEQPATFYKSCKELYNNGVKSNGIYQINIGEEKPLSVYCDMETDGGGWTVFQRRQDGSVDFFRDWKTYKYGFGMLNSEFWLGNKYLNLLTDDDQEHELRIDLEDFNGDDAYAKYSSFKVHAEKTFYRLEVGNYKGVAGDSLDKDFDMHNGMGFSTKDVDDNSDCAFRSEGGWWFSKGSLMYTRALCFFSHLNGRYQQNEDCARKKRKCIIWKTWKGLKYSLKFTEMKLR